MAHGGGKKSLQDVLRARRAAPSLLSPAEAAQREASRRLEEETAAATAAVERWRGGRSPDAPAKLTPGAYRALHRLDPAAYEATQHWARRVKAQLAVAPACEVERCASPRGVRVHHLTHENLGQEEPSRDLITLCGGCHRRAQKLGRGLGRLPRRTEIAALDPLQPLYEPAEIAALRAKYGS